MAKSLGRGLPSWHWELLAAVVIGAIVLRVVAIDAEGLWTDEALTIVLSNWPIDDMLLQPTDPTPLLYYSIHKLFLSAHSSIAAIRSISVVAGVMSVGLMYSLGRLSFGAVGGLLAAALLSVWSAHVDYSQDARAYSVLFLFTLLTSFGLLYYCQLLRGKSGERNAGQRALALGLFGIGNVLSFYTHVIAIFWIAITSIILLAMAVRERRILLPELFTVFGLMVVCAAPGVYRLLLQMMVGDDFHWLRQRGFDGLVGVTADVLLPIGLWDNPITNAHRMRLVGKAVIIAASIAAVSTGFWFTGRQMLRSLRESPALLCLILAYLMIPVVLWLFGFVVRPLLMARVILFCVPGMILLITGVCLAMGERIGARVGIAMVFLYGASTLLFGIMREKEDWRGAYAYLAGSASRGDVIAVCPLYAYPALRYHASAPVASAVLSTAASGRAVQIENGLGSNPDWDKTYFNRVLLGGRAAELNAQMAGRLQLEPGQSVWRVDGKCTGGSAAGMEVLLRAVDVDTNSAWIERRRHPSIDAITIRRYRVVLPVVLDVRLLASP